MILGTHIVNAINKAIHKIKISNDKKAYTVAVLPLLHITSTLHLLHIDNKYERVINTNTENKINTSWQKIKMIHSRK